MPPAADDPDLDRTLRSAIGALDTLGLRWAVVGGLAVSAWSSPRATRDVDLYSELPVEGDALRLELERRDFIVPAEITERLRRALGER